LAGLSSGLGAATADAIFGLIATFSLTIVTDFLRDWHDFLMIGAGFLLVYLGIKALRHPPSYEGKLEDGVEMASACTDWLDAMSAPCCCCCTTPFL
jgi:threonine/homoserine/homoserine lactone efflux protein